MFKVGKDSEECLKKHHFFKRPLNVFKIRMLREIFSETSNYRAVRSEEFPKLVQSFSKVKVSERDD